MKIGIVSLGGRSSVAVAEACKKYFEKVDELDIKQFEVRLTNKGVNVTYGKKDLDNYDCLYIRGSYKYALLQRSITRALRKDVFIPIKHSAFTIGHDKFLTLLELQSNDIAIPKTFFAATKELAKKILEKEVDYPVIMKVSQGTHGKGVMIADSLKSANTILDILDDFKQPYLIQEFVETPGTTDVRVIVAGEEVVAAYKRQAAEGEIRSNVHSGGKRMIHELTEKEKELAINSAKALGIEICGVDILNAENPSVIEVNLSPSFDAVKEVTGFDVSDKIAKFLYNRTLKFKKNKIRKVRRKMKKAGGSILSLF